MNYFVGKTQGKVEFVSDGIDGEQWVSSDPSNQQYADITQHLNEIQGIYGKLVTAETGRMPEITEEEYYRLIHGFIYQAKETPRVTQTVPYPPIGFQQIPGQDPGNFYRHGQENTFLSNEPDSLSRYNPTTNEWEKTTLQKNYLEKSLNYPRKK